MELKLLKYFGILILMLGQHSVHCDEESTDQVEEDCTHLLEVIAVVDGSDSIWDEDFTKLKNATIKLTERLNLQGGQRFGAVVFSSSVSDTAPLNNNKSVLKTQINNFLQPKMGTSTHRGIQKMTEMMELEGRPGVPKVGIVITDGRSINPVATQTAARGARDDGINMFAVGVGYAINATELYGIASSNDSVLMLKNFDELLASVTSLVKKVCIVNGGWSEWSNATKTTCSATCGGGTRTCTQTRTCTNPTPSNGGRHCVGSDINVYFEDCGMHSCPKDGGWSEWSNRSKTVCSATCGGGSRTYTLTRTCTNPSPAHGGRYCQGSETSRYTETCNTNGCPATPDLCHGCLYNNGIGYVSHPSDCSKFVQCILGWSPVVKSCAPGTRWHQPDLTCRLANQVTCDVTGARTTPAASLCSGKRPVNGNSQAYEMYVNGQGWAWRPCPSGSEFDVTECDCIFNSVEDAPDVIIQTPKPCSDHRKLSGVMYEQNVYGHGWVRRYCAAGTVFDENACHCVTGESSDPVSQPDCQAEVYLPFDADLNDHSRNKVHIQNVGVTLTSGGFASFRNNSGLRILRLSNMDFAETLIISFLLHPGQTSRSEAIVSNADCEKEGSVYIVQTSSSVNFTVLNKKNIRHSVSLSFTTPTPQPRNRMASWISVSLAIHDSVMTARVGNKTNSVRFEGTIGKSHCALQIGRARGFEDFTGDLDNFALYLCKPDEAV